LIYKLRIKLGVFLFLSSLVLVACSSGRPDFKSRVPVGVPVGVRAEELPKQINLDVPFFAQAPEGDWSMPWQEACEEASVVLAYYYATGKDLSKEQFKKEVLALVDWQNEVYGDYEHTSMNQTLEILKANYELEVGSYELLEDPTINDLKRELAQGNVIIAPFAGRQLGNPFYSGEGPYYHVMLLKGYDEKHFIANDVGTKRGENFNYSYETIMSAMHDWDDEDVELAERRVILVKRES